MFFRKNVETKAVTSHSGTVTTMTTTLPDTAVLTQDPVRLMNYNRGYVYAANNKVAEAVGSLPFRLYAYLPESEAASLVTPSRALGAKAMKAVLATQRLNLGEPKTLLEIFEHPFLTLMDEPAPNWSRYDWFKVVSSYLGLIGNAFVEVKRSGGAIVSLTPLMSECVTVTYDRDGVITRYVYSPPGTQTRRELEPGDVLHLKNRTAGSLIAGMGNLEAALASANLSTSTQAYLSALMQNMSLPGGVFTIKNFSGNPDQADKFANKLRERFGRKNRGKPMVTFGDVTYTRADATMHDSRADFFTSQCKQEIAAVFGVPLTLLDESNSNRATAMAAKQAMLQYAVYPRTEMILGDLNRLVRAEYDNRVMFSYDPGEALETDPSEQKEVLTSYVENGIYTKDEARAVLGMPPLNSEINR